MQGIHALDIVIIGVYFALVFAIAAYFTRKAGTSTNNFFLSGRNLPWWLAGTAMVATTFAADTPLAVTELVAKNGIAGNWLWWNLAIGGMLTVFFFAKLWRRAEIVTDVEFTEMRYSGKPAAALRGFRALYLGIFMNGIVLAWVHKAMEKIFHVTVPGIDPFMLTAIIAGIIGIYAAASGLLGTARTDAFQFLFAMTGCIIFAIIVLQAPEIGGAAHLKEQLAPQVMSFFPKIGNVSLYGVTGGVLALSVGAFFAHIGLQWWSTWYPGADPGGGGYIAQRMMSTKDEKHSVFATLWFTIAHYTLRPWPWIIIALAALVILPRADNPSTLETENPAMYVQVVTAYNDQPLLKTDNPVYQTTEFKEFYEKYENTVDPGVMYPKLMMKFLPTGLLGLLIAVFLAAYMSTIASQLNWGTSYIINDFYRRFIKRNGDEKHYILVSRISMLLMVVFSLWVTRLLTTISGAWEFIINASAGMGAVLIFRWFWWRINAWSEISAMIAPLIIYPIAKYGYGMQSPMTLYPIVAGTTIVWLVVTYLTKPVDTEVLLKFYRKTHPGGIGWKPISKQLPGVKSDTGFGKAFVAWMCGIVLIYSTLFGFGKLIFADYVMAAVYLAIATIAAVAIYLYLSKVGWKTVSE